MLNLHAVQGLKVSFFFVSSPHQKALVVLQGVYTFRGMVAVASVIYSEQENEDKVLPELCCFDRH